MAQPAPRIDFANLPTPEEGILVTLFITVRSVARSRDFYSRVLGGTVVLEPVRGTAQSALPGNRATGPRASPEDGMALDASWRGGSVGMSADGRIPADTQGSPCRSTYG